MYFCYLDESGGAEPPDLAPNATPVMVIAGLIVEANKIPALTRDFLAFKRRFFPGKFTRGPALDHVLIEVKGGDLLQMTRSGSRNRRRQADRARTNLLELVNAYGCRLVGRVWVKEAGKRLKPDATYCYAVQDIALHFSQFLSGQQAKGLLIADSRAQPLNVAVAHSIFTQKWRTGGDPFLPLAEVPLFAHSDNHVGIQIADLLASAFVFPMAASAYGTPAGSIHGSCHYHAIRDEFGPALRDLQYQYRDETGRWRGGLVVSDPVGKRPGTGLFGSWSSPWDGDRSITGGFPEPTTPCAAAGAAD